MDVPVSLFPLHHGGYPHVGLVTGFELETLQDWLSQLTLCLANIDTIGKVCDKLIINCYTLKYSRILIMNTDKTFSVTIVLQMYFPYH